MSQLCLFILAASNLTLVLYSQIYLTDNSSSGSSKQCRLHRLRLRNTVFYFDFVQYYK